MKAIKANILGLLYFNEIMPGRYDASKASDRQIARGHFIKLKKNNIDQKCFKKALDKYIDMVREEAANLHQEGQQNHRGALRDKIQKGKP